MLNTSFLNMGSLYTKMKRNLQIRLIKENFPHIFQQRGVPFTICVKPVLGGTPQIKFYKLLAIFSIHLSHNTKYRGPSKSMQDALQRIQLKGIISNSPVPNIVHTQMLFTQSHGHESHLVVYPSNY